MYTILSNRTQKTGSVAGQQTMKTNQVSVEILDACTKLRRSDTLAGKEGTQEFVRCLNHFEKAFMDDEHWL